ncbi:hypothetical protein DSO57_1009635 [Entomophthora muscae]|uniref:Uncharacterized protein n=1 Tax=Entomophthora muscae TaxID=34485 RepID=A0ACC2U5H8_9FUNG|nr:hypothetical protein DSO57_1009635 [Entomophthora muscae]
MILVLGSFPDGLFCSCNSHIAKPPPKIAEALSSALICPGIESPTSSRVLRQLITAALHVLKDAPSQWLLWGSWSPVPKVCPGS